MSYDAERWARSQKVGNASAKFVLIELANALNKDDVECYPGIDTLEESTELNRKTVLAATKLLEEKGFIKKPREDPSSLRRSFDAPSLSGLRLRLSLHRRLALVISHSIVDSVAGHRSCGRTEERTPEATAGRGRSRLIHSLVDDGRVLLHDCRALRCIALRRSRTGEGTTAAEPTTTSCFRSCRNEKGDRNGRHNSFLHR